MTSEVFTYVLGIGGNVVAEGEGPLHRLKQALNQLPIDHKAASRFYESDALLPPGAPANWNRPYFNFAVKGQSTLPPQELLPIIKSLEIKLGRTPRGRWAPREVDIDILVVDSLVIDDADLDLKIPHPGLLERPFALLPLVEVWPNWKYPKPGLYKNKTAMELAGDWLGDPKNVPFSTHVSSIQ